MGTPPPRDRVVRIEQSTRDGCTIITLTGHLDRAAVPRLQQLLLGRLREQPIAVICDLSEVWTLDPASASVFATAAHHPASGWIAPKLLLCCAQPAIATMLAGLPAPHRLPLHPSVEDAINQAFQDAIDQVLNHPLWLQHELELAPSPTAPAAARRFVRALCTSWDLNLADDPDDPTERAWLADRVDQAVLVTSELVTNAVVHAHSELRLLVELRGDQLHLAVQDASPHLLHLATSPDVLEEGGRGLLLVEALASTWQVQHPLDGGKVVACVLDLAH
jgi:anti-anti-sigma regulatory factor